RCAARSWLGLGCHAAEVSQPGRVAPGGCSRRVARARWITIVLVMASRILVVDNYDSFVYNLVQELGELGALPVVFRNDAIDVAGIRAAAPDAVLISPGPG